MRNIIYLFITIPFLFLSCSSDEDDDKFIPGQSSRKKITKVTLEKDGKVFETMEFSYKKGVLTKIKVIDSGLDEIYKIADLDENNERFITFDDCEFDDNNRISIEDYGNNSKGYYNYSHTGYYTVRSSHDGSVRDEFTYDGNNNIIKSKYNSEITYTSILNKTGIYIFSRSSDDIKRDPDFFFGLLGKPTTHLPKKMVWSQYKDGRYWLEFDYKLDSEGYVEQMKVIHRSKDYYDVWIENYYY